jgi:hypothetical protein
MYRYKILPLLSVLMVGGCATTGTVNPGATLLSGLAEYQGEMQKASKSSSSWPERQHAAGMLKIVITSTVGESPEFYRLVDLDARKREFIVTLRDGSVRPDRQREMKEELAQMEEEIATLKPLVRAQLGAVSMGGEAQQRFESVATLGLLNLALDKFSANSVRGIEAPSTKVDEFLVTDLGSFATVRGADGRTHRCALFAAPENAAGMRCDAIK